MDDYFGCSRAGVKWNGSELIASLARLVGTPCDPDKAAHSMTSLALLGADVMIEATTMQPALRLQPLNAERYSRVVRRALETQELSPGEATQLAGKSNVATCVARHTIGRAYIRPLYMQAHHPVQGLSFWGALALQWWDAWLQCEATMWISPNKNRRCVHGYTDASGADRWLAAYLKDENGIWWWTRIQVPLDIWDLFSGKR